MKYITILDFSTSEIHIFKLPKKIELEFPDIAFFIEKNYGIHFNPNNCEWIIQDELKLQIH